MTPSLASRAFSISWSRRSFQSTLCRRMNSSRALRPRLSFSAAQVLDRGGEALALLVHELPHELDLVVDAVGRGALAQHVVAEAEALRFHHVDDAVVRGNVA